MEGEAASETTTPTEIEQDTPSEAPSTTDQTEPTESTEDEEAPSEDASEEGTDADFPVETDEEREERLARVRLEQDEAVEQDYQNAYDQSEDFDPAAVDSEYGLGNYYQSGDNDFADAYDDEVQAEIAELEMYGAVSEEFERILWILFLDYWIPRAKGEIIQQYPTGQERVQEDQLPIERWVLQITFPDDPGLKEQLRMESQEILQDRKLHHQSLNRWRELPTSYPK